MIKGAASLPSVITYDRYDVIEKEYYQLDLFFDPCKALKLHGWNQITMTEKIEN